MKKAFSLIELMIVIVIIGVVYTLVITKLHDVNEEKKKLSLQTLKSFMYKQIHDAQDATLICKDDCLTCKLYIDKKEVSTIENLIDASIEVYKYTYSQALVPQNLQECFVFHVNRNRVSDQYIIVFQEKVYDFTEYFQDVKVYNSLTDFTNEKEKLIQEVK